MRCVFINLLLLLSFRLCAQVDIYIREHKITITPKTCNEERIIKFPDSSYIKINLVSCWGKLSLQNFDKKGVLLAEGYYCESLDTLKEYVTVHSLDFSDEKMIVYKYFEPLKDGIWTFYN